MSNVDLRCGDCLELMQNIPSQSVDMVMCDLPYGTTACHWDSVIPLEPLWAHYKRIIKPRGAIVLTASQPFTTTLIASNMAWFKYGWVWVKNRPSDKFNAKNKPMKKHEDIAVFSDGTTANCSQRRMPYFPQGLGACQKEVRGTTGKRHHGSRPSHVERYVIYQTHYPHSVLEFPKDDADTVHPTQKPVALMEYLIRTYTNEGELVLDNTFGSCTTGVACVNTGRRFIGIEKERGFFEIGERRVKEALKAKQIAESRPQQGWLF